MSECAELKNIKYQSMLLNNSNKDSSYFTQNSKNNSLQNIDEFLAAENAISRKESWGRLNKTIKLSKLDTWADTYSNNNKLDNSVKNNLKLFLKNSLDKNKLQKVKDVVYDKDAQEIVNIPNLTLNSNNKFILNRNDKRVSTLKSLGNGRKNKNK
jgi:hypothetical protein